MRLQMQINGEDHLAGNERAVEADARHATLCKTAKRVGATGAEDFTAVWRCAAHTRAADLQKRLWNARSAMAEHPR